MRRHDNEYETILLHTDPHAFLLHYQNLISIIVKKYISKRMFTTAQYKDIIQTINTELLERMPSIQQNYNGTALLVTYMTIIVNNICKKTYTHQKQTYNAVSLQDIIDEDTIQKQAYNAVTLQDIIDEDTISTENAIIIQEEVKKLGAILQTYGREKNKIILMLKIFFRLPITLHDITRCYHKVLLEHAQALLDEITENYEQRSDVEVFSHVASFVNIYEKKETHSDSLRRWTQRMQDEILVLINGASSKQTHTKETLEILFENYLFNSLYKSK